MIRKILKIILSSIWEACFDIEQIEISESESSGWPDVISVGCKTPPLEGETLQPGVQTPQPDGNPRRVAEKNSNGLQRPPCGRAEKTAKRQGESEG